jgi:branched-chain amino acid transport system substrate-binding protein
MASLALGLFGWLGAAHGQTAPDCGMNTGKKADGIPLPIGALVSKTGPNDFSASSSSAAAYFKCVNDNGGIHGRPIEYIVKDDQWNLDMAAEAAKSLVNERKVVGMIGGSSFVECTANAKFYAQQNILALIGTGVYPTCFHSPSYAPFNTGPRIAATVAAQYAVKLGPVKTAACLVPNVKGFGDWGCKGAADWGAKNGIKVRTIQVPLNFSSGKEVMLDAAKGKPDLIIMNLNTGMLIPLMGAAKALDLAESIRFIATTPAYSAEVAKALGPYWKDRFHVSFEFNPVEGNGPDMRNWRAVLDKYALKTDSRDSFSQSGYLAARLATKVLLAMDPNTIDRKSFSAALQKTRLYESDILCKPFYVGAGKRHNANNSGPVAAFDGSKWVVVPGGCIQAEDPELADLLRN